MADTDLRLGVFRRWYNICRTYVHQAATGGGTTFPYEQLPPTSPNDVFDHFYAFSYMDLKIIHIFLDNQGLPLPGIFTVKVIQEIL